MKAIQRNKGFLAILAFCALVISCIALTMTLQHDVSAAGSSANYSFPTMAEAATQYLNQVNKPGDTYEGLEEITSISFGFGRAGGLLGYEDSEINDRESLFIITSTSSNNAVEYDYKALAQLKTTTRVDVQGSGIPSSVIDIISKRATATFSQYAYFGTALNLLGFDSTNVNGTNDSSRMIMGIIMIAAYVLSVGLDAFFQMIFSLLQLANPFKLFAGSSTNNTSVLSRFFDNRVSTAADSANPDTTLAAVENAMDAALVEIADAFASIYDVLHSVSLGVILPITFAAAIFLWLVVRKGTGFWATWKGFFVKLVFVCIGVPLMSACYFTAIDLCSNLVGEKINGTKVIASTFCDFESWVITSNLRLPDGFTISIDTENCSLSSNTVSQTRAMCAAINDESGAVDDGLLKTYGGRDASLSFAGYDSYFLNSESYTSTDGSNFDNFSKDFGNILTLLQKYARGDKISASAYEAYAKSNIKTTEAYISMCQLSSHWTYFVADEATEVSLQDVAGDVKLTEDYVRNSAINRWDHAAWVYDDWGTAANDTNSVMNIWANDGGNSATTSGYKIFFTRSGDNKYGLSTMSMYNYLSTDFRPNKMIVYSALNVANDQVKVEHYAVNLVGSGLMQVIYFLDALVLLGCMSVIGYGYGFAMLIGNLKSIFKFLPSIFTGMLGFMRGIASCFALTAALICEVIITMLLYSVACDAIGLAYNAIEIPLATLLSETTGKFSTSFTNAAEIITPLMGVISIFVIISITKKLLEWRHAVVQSTVDGCTAVINKFLGTSISSPDLDSKPGTLAGKIGNAASIATGLAMASGSLTDSDTFGSVREGAANAKDSFIDTMTGRNGNNDLANAFGVKEGNGTGMDENGVVGNTSSIDTANLSGESAGSDGVFDARGRNLDNAAEDYVKNNDESTLFGTGSGRSNLTSGSGELSNQDKFDYYNSLGTDDAEAMLDYEEADMADDGKLNKSADSSILADKSKAGGGGFTTGNVNARPKASDDYKAQYDAEYAETDLADNGMLDGSAVEGKTLSDGRVTAATGSKSASADYRQNYTMEYASADFADDGKYNGSVEAVVSEEYIQADMKDNGRADNSVALGEVKTYTTSGGGRPNARPGKAYQENYSVEYAQQDFADDGQFNGSVEISGKNDAGKFVSTGQPQVVQRTSKNVVHETQTVVSDNVTETYVDTIQQGAAAAAFVAGVSLGSSSQGGGTRTVIQHVSGGGGGTSATEYVTEHVMNDTKPSPSTTHTTVIHQSGGNGGSEAKEYVSRTVFKNESSGGGAPAHEYSTTTVVHENSAPSYKNRTVEKSTVSQRYSGSGSSGSRGSVVHHTHTDVVENKVVHENVTENVTKINTEHVTNETVKNSFTKNSGSTRKVESGLMGSKPSDNSTRK